MKIGPLPGALQFLDSIRSKRDGEGGAGGNAYERQQKQKKNDDEKNREPATPEKVVEAVEAFGTDTMAQANGLSASVEGRGPGLKVVLKDVSGTVVRQFSGEEFLKLREAGHQKNARGKILDQKL